MTRTQFVEYADQGFWAYDVALGIFLKHLIDAAEANSKTHEPWLEKAVSWWREVACISLYCLRLDDHVPEGQRRAFIALVESACEQLARRETITAEEVASWPLFKDETNMTRGQRDVPTAPLIELGRAIIAVVSGTLPEAPAGTCWYYTTDGCRTMECSNAEVLKIEKRPAPPLRD